MALSLGGYEVADPPLEFFEFPFTRPKSVFEPPTLIFYPSRQKTSRRLVLAVTLRQNRRTILEQRNWYEVTRQFTVRRMNESGSRAMSVGERVMADTAYWRSLKSSEIRFYFESDQLAASVDMFERSTRRAARTGRVT